jgi:hypothetical protein
MSLQNKSWFHGPFTWLLVAVIAVGVPLGYAAGTVFANFEVGGTAKCVNQQKICQGANAVLCDYSDNGLPDGCRESSCETLCNNLTLNEKACGGGGTAKCCYLGVRRCPQTHTVCYCNMICLCVTLFGCFDEECSPDAYNATCTESNDC